MIILKLKNIFTLLKSSLYKNKLGSYLVYNISLNKKRKIYEFLDDYQMIAN